MLSGLGRSISHALVPPGLDPSPPSLLDSEGCGLQAGGWPGAALHPFSNFSCSNFVFASRQLFGFTCFWLGLGVIVGLGTPYPPYQSSAVGRWGRPTVFVFWRSATRRLKGLRGR